ncbi:hypothetical protein like AT2G32235 [Hibiscus trionum]|uniref:Uncharacterized protein n=1 Tax=Hibiscus trionum TaxID=183268 RepID=A0A9W7HKI7_HIBTR|nr:hypothetical protein like AT2G32235 [Hibiscus trionum]
MSEMTQEPEFQVPHQEEEEEDNLKLQESINLSYLHLDNSNNNSAQQNRHSCATCACNLTMKRPSPGSIFEPKPNKPLVENHPYTLSGFSKLPLPQLRRTVSEPFTPTKTSLSDTAKALEDTPMSKGSASSSLPPKPLSRASSSQEMDVELVREESPSSKRLKSIKLRMNEITNSWGETVKEMENLLCSEATKDKGELDCEEAVTVEKIGECLDLHFKCPCGKGYKILLSGKNCYYKLI